MKLQSWPELDPISNIDRSLVTYTRGLRFTLTPAHDSEGRVFHVRKGEDLMAVMSIDQGEVVDFTVTHDLVAVATVAPAAIHLLKNAANSQVFSMKIPLELSNDSGEVGSVSIGNYGSNLLIVWHNREEGPVFIGMISGRDALRFTYKPLIYYDGTGRQQLHIHEANETTIAVPHMPNQYSTIASIKPGGLRLYSLKPYFVRQKFTDFLADNFMLVHHYEPLTTIQRLHYGGNDWTLHASLSGGHFSMQYAPDDLVKETDFDWVRIEIDGVPIDPATNILFDVADVDHSLKITALHELENLVLHADLPVTIRGAAETPQQGVSEYTIPTLLKGESAALSLRPMQCLTPWYLARFIEKMNIKIRANVYKTFA